MRLASVEGLAALTIGRLADEVGVSKSGVYAHFGSKQNLQMETIAAAAGVFAREVMEPGLAQPPGLAQLMGVCDSFLSYVERAVFPGGCFFAGLLVEFDAQPGPVHDQVATDQKNWLEMLAGMARTAQENGELSPDIDVDQLAFEVHAALELTNYHYALYHDERVIERGRAGIHNALGRSRES